MDPEQAAEAEENEVVDGAPEGQPEAEEAPAVEAAGEVKVPEEEAGEAKPTDKLLDPDKQPVWLKTLLAHAQQDDLGVTEEELDNLPIEAQRVVVNLLRRAQHTQGAISEESKKLSEEREKLSGDERRVAAERADLLKWAQNPKLKEFLSTVAPKGQQPDPYSPEGIDYLVAKGVHEKLSAFFSVLTEVDKAQRDELAKADAAAEREKAVQKIQAYMEEHREDFEDETIFAAVKELRQKSKGALSVQEAHEIVMARLAVEEDKEAHAKALTRARARNKSSKGGRLPTAAKPAKFDSAEAEARFYRDNPDALRQQFESDFRDGFI